MSNDEKINLINQKLLDNGFDAENTEVAQSFITILDEFARSDNLEEDHRHCGGFEQIYCLSKNYGNSGAETYFSGKNIENLYSEYQKEFTNLYQFFNDDGEIEDPIKRCVENCDFDLNEAKRRIVVDGLEQIYNYDLLDIYMQDKADIAKEFAQSKGYDVESILDELHINTQETKSVRKRR